MTKRPPERVLIVDDEPDIALILKLHLEEAGFITSWSADGESALKLLDANGHDLILLDVRMPGISGIEVLHRLRAGNHDTPVIMMTAHGNENLVVECMKAGAADYVAKPFDMDDMMIRMKRVIETQRVVRQKKFLEKEKEDFIFMLSHDMKNPITAVMGSIDIMREGRLGAVNPEQVDYLQSAIESCEEVVTMIDNLLDVQRFETGRMPLRTGYATPCSLLEKTVKRFLPAAEREKITLTLTGQSDLPEIAMDGSIMTRVFANLIGNALKFVPEGGSIALSCRCIQQSKLSKAETRAAAAASVSLSATTHCVRISVTDTGTGISSDDLTRIFERYVQSGNTSIRSRGGAGLGLAFCKKAVESFGGCIWAESDEGKGSRFIILLPCRDSADVKPSIPEKLI